MAIELQAVVWTTVILFVLLFIQGMLVPLKQGFAWGLGSRDESREITAFQGRATRTVSNHIEGMLMFVPLVLVAQMSGISSPLTVWGAGLYLGSRVVYAPLYMLGVPLWRSIAWAGAVAGTVMVAIALIAYMI